MKRLFALFLYTHKNTKDPEHINSIQFNREVKIYVLYVKKFPTICARVNLKVATEQWHTILPIFLTILFQHQASNSKFSISFPSTTRKKRDKF